jgi:hypothetical protein
MRWIEEEIYRKVKQVFNIYYLSLIFSIISYLPLFISSIIISYLLSLIHPTPIRHRLGRQNTPLWRHCAPEGEAQPP